MLIQKFLYLAIIFFALDYANSCDVKINDRPLIKEQPVLVKSVTNGEKYVIGDLNDPQNNYLYLAKLKGTSYEMGLAYGQLFKDEIRDNLNNFFDFEFGQVYQALVKNHIPKFISSGITTGLHQLALGLLDLNILITKRYTNPRYGQQMAGIAKGSGLTKRDIQRVNLVPQLIKAACTVAGAWGKATGGNRTLHVRALDWAPDNPISKYPLIIIYHPSTKGEQKHANLAWAGFVGVLTGMSEHITLGQKVWLPPYGTVKTTRYGNPWTYVLRDVLYKATNLSTAIEVLQSSRRTCAIHLGLGSKQDHSFRMILYSENILINYDDKNFTGYNETCHPKKEGIAFWDKRVQPSDNPCVGSILTHPNFYGRWQLQSLWKVLGLSHQTGDTQYVVFDLENQELLISYSRQYRNETKNETIVEKAFTRRPIYVNTKQFWEQF